MNAPTQSTALARAASTGLAGFAAGANPFLNRPKEEGVTDGQFLRMNGKTGEYIGTNDVKVDHGTQMVFDLMECIEAWQGFDDANTLHRGPEVKFKEGRKLADPDRSNAKVKWGKVIRIQARTLDGAPAYTLTCKADKPTREIWKLIKKYGEQMARNIDQQGRVMLPVIEISARSYSFKAKEEKLVTNKDTGIKEVVETEQTVTNFSEVFPIVGWISVGELEEIIQAAAAGGDGEEVEVVDEGNTPPPQVTQQPPAPEIVVQADKPTLATATQPATGELKQAPQQQAPVQQAPQGASGGPARRFTTGRVGSRV